MMDCRHEVTALQGLAWTAKLTLWAGGSAAAVVCAGWITLVIIGGFVSHAGVTPVGSDTYRGWRQGWISTQSLYALRQDVFSEAETYCALKGRQVLLDVEDSQPGAIGGFAPRVDVQFRCLAKDDPALTKHHRGIIPIPNVPLGERRN